MPVQQAIRIEGKHILCVHGSDRRNNGRRGYIHHTAVDTAKRTRGIGTELVNAALEALKNEGINKVALVELIRMDT